MFCFLSCFCGAALFLEVFCIFFVPGVFASGIEVVSSCFSKLNCFALLGGRFLAKHFFQRNETYIVVSIM